MNDDQARAHIKNLNADSEETLLDLYDLYREKMDPGPAVERVLLVRLDILRGGTGDPAVARAAIFGAK